MNVQKGFRATYQDEACTKKAFSSIEAFRNADSLLKQQIIAAYDSVEMDNDDVKN